MILNTCNVNIYSDLGPNGVRDLEKRRHIYIYIGFHYYKHFKSPSDSETTKNI